MTTTFDVEFEDAVLAQALRDDGFLKKAVRIADSHHFGSVERAWLWKVIKETWEKYRERASGGLIAARAKDEFRDAEKRKPYLSLALRLAKKKPEAPLAALDELSKFVRLVNLQLALERSSEALEKGDLDDAEKALNQATRSSGVVRNYTHIRWIEEFEERQATRKYEKEHPDEFKVVPTGLKKLDKALGGGARLGELCLIMGTTGRGKSVKLSNIVHNSIKYGHPAVYFGLEMPARQIAARHDSRWTQLRYDQFKAFDFKPSELRALDRSYRRAAKKYSNMFHIISMPVRSADIRTIVGALDDLQAEYGFRATTIAVDSGDHLKHTDKSLDQYRLQQAEVYWELKRLAEEEGYVIWSTVHAGREWAGKTATAEASAESYDKSRIADLVVSVNDPFSGKRRRVELSTDEDAPGMDEEPPEVEIGAAVGHQKLELFLAKYRDGVSKLKINLDCDFTRMLMREADSEETSE